VDAQLRAQRRGARHLFVRQRDGAVAEIVDPFQRILVLDVVPLAALMI
tara:strand:- start:133 stop:276 length:144 start_codon:yes stop_codon:yes gene_type:complete